MCIYSLLQPTKGKDFRIFAGGWLSNPRVHSVADICLFHPTGTHIPCVIHALAAAWHSFVLEQPFLEPAQMQSVLGPHLVEGHCVTEVNHTAISVYSLLLASRLSPVCLQGRNYLKLVPPLCRFEVIAAIWTWVLEVWFRLFWIFLNKLVKVFVTLL